MFGNYLGSHSIKISMRHMILSLLLVCIVFTGMPSALALVTNSDNLAFSEIEVGSRQEDERRRALGRAMLKVLVRLTGSSWLAETEQLNGVFDDAEPYMRSYNYRTDTREDGSEHIILEVIFELKFLYDLMEAENLLLWPVGRPTILLWVLEEDIDGNKRIQSNDTTPEIVQTTDKYNDYYGMSVRLPLGDLQDTNALNAQDILNTDKQLLRKASLRYLVDSILVGHLYGSDAGGWYTKWEYLESTADAERAMRAHAQEKQKSRPHQVTDYLRQQELSHIGNSQILLSCRSRTDCMSYILDALRNMLLKRDGIFPSELKKGEFSIRIENVNSYEEYQQVSRYLNELNLTEYVTPKLFDLDMVVYEVGSQRLPRSFFDALNRKQKLILVTEVDSELDIRDIELRYRWAGR